MAASGGGAACSLGCAAGAASAAGAAGAAGAGPPAVAAPPAEAGSDSDEDFDEDPGGGALAAAAWRPGDEGDPPPGAPRRFGLQFEHVVPDSALGASEVALAELGAGAGADARAPAGARPDALELRDLPDRFWTVLRRPFFRYMRRSYRLLDGRWQQVPDPRGPRPAPRRRFRPKQERQEQRLRREMQGARADAA